MNKEESIRLFWEKATPPQDALRKIDAGRLKGMSDINPQWRVEALTELYGMYGVGWFIEIKHEQIVDCPETKEKMIFLTLALYVRDWGIPEEYKWFGPAIGIGGDFLIVKEKAGLHCNDEAYAMALTDALGKAAKLLGVANNIYRGKNDSKYGRRDDREKHNQIKEENYQLRNDGLYIKGQSGFVSIETLSKEQLEAIKDFKKFEDVKYLIEKRISEL